MAKKDNNDAPIESRTITIGEIVASSDKHYLIPFNDSLVDVQTFESSITERVCSDVDNIVATNDSRIYCTMDSLVITRVAPMKSVNASSGRHPGNVMIDPDQRKFSGNIEGLHMTASSRLNSSIDLNTIDKTRGSITVEVEYFSVNERNFYRQSHTHHRSD